MSDTLKLLADSLGGRIAALAEQAEAACALVERIRRALPEELGIHVVSASYRGTTLTIGVDSGVWGPRIRFKADAMHQELIRDSKTSFEKLRVKVVTPSPRHAR